MVNTGKQLTAPDVGGIDTWLSDKDQVKEEMQRNYMQRK